MVMMSKIYQFLIIPIALLSSVCASPKNEAINQGQIHEAIMVGEIGYDPYGRDCSGGISIHIKDATISKGKIGENVFIKPTHEKFILPDGLIPSGGNKLKFYGHFENEKCTHLMGSEGADLELFFVYDSIHIACPYKYFDIEKMEFDSQTCGKHDSFHARIKIVE